MEYLKTQAVQAREMADRSTAYVATLPNGEIRDVLSVYAARAEHNARIAESLLSQDARDAFIDSI